MYCLNSKIYSKIRIENTAIKLFYFTNGIKYLAVGKMIVWQNTFVIDHLYYNLHNIAKFIFFESSK